MHIELTVQSPFPTNPINPPVPFSPSAAPEREVKPAMEPWHSEKLRTSLFLFPKTNSTALLDPLRFFWRTLHHICSSSHLLSTQTLSSRTSLWKLVIRTNMSTHISLNYLSLHFLSLTHLGSTTILSYTKFSKLIWSSQSQKKPTVIWKKIT